MNQKWYLQTWLIAILFAFWFFIIPGIVGIILLILQTRNSQQIITNLELERKQIEKTKEKLNLITLEQVRKQISKDKDAYAKQKSLLRNEIKNLTENRDTEKEKLLSEVSEEINNLQTKMRQLETDEQKKRTEILKLSRTIADKKAEIVQLDDEILYQDFGIYTPIYNLMNSQAYKDRIAVVRARQKEMIKSDTACTFPTNITQDGSVAKGKKLVKDQVKQILRSFNSECEMAIDKVKFNNIESIRKRIEKSRDALNKMNASLGISITPAYLSLKLEELNLCYEYAVKKQEEKEEARRIREEQREEQKLLKEIEAARKKAKKEQEHYQNALSQVLNQLESASDDEKEALLAKKQEIESHLSGIDTEIKSIDYREANQRAGYVYVISNIGSFGENIYKIGMTRRLEPQDRVDELGDASVPFRFDVHAMIFSEDAPALESALHKAFENKKVNMMNNRKEFFNVTLEEIEAVVKKNYDKTVEFVKVPQADQYRETIMLKKNAI